MHLWRGGSALLGGYMLRHDRGYDSEVRSPGNFAEARAPELMSAFDPFAGIGVPGSIVRMSRLEPFSEQVRANFPKVEASPDFAASQLWLTLYLSARPEDLWIPSEVLADNGAVGECGRLGKRIYLPKASRWSKSRLMRSCERQWLRRVCANQHSAEIILIDADTSPDVQQSRFITLYAR